MKNLSRQSAFRQLLLLRDLVTAKEAMQELGISQPTFSRLLDSMKTEILFVGNARSRKYALKRTIKYLPQQKKHEKIPVYIVDDGSKVKHAATIYPVSGKSFYVESHIDELKSQFYPDMPYWLNDLRPSGFLGRLIPKLYPETGYPKDIRLWSGDCCMSYWMTLGWDLIGNFIVGEASYELFAKKLVSPPALVREPDILTDYSRIVEDVLSKGTAGSSAAGEQPKFLAVKEQDGIPVLVKFSPEGKDPLTLRRKDLLICEHICLETLRDHSISATKSRLLSSDKRIFLELERFDREGLKGRRGLITLHSLDMEFTGVAGNWREISNALYENQIISQQLYQEILWRFNFGLCIGNTDMHSGNLSFFSYGEKIESLAPVYDMLPMIFSPVHDEVLKPKFTPPTLSPSDEKILESVLKVAIEFWDRVMEDQRVSDDIKKATLKWKDYLVSIL